MKTYVFTPADATYRVKYVTNGLGSNENISIYAIESIKAGVLTTGLLAEGQAAGLNDEYIETTVSVLKAKAASLNMTLQVYEDNKAVVTLDSTEALFTAFSFEEQTGAATIDNDELTIDVEVEFGTDVTALVATFTTSLYCSVTNGETAIVSGTTEVDYTSEVTLTVSVGNTTNDYAVNVTVASE